MRTDRRSITRFGSGTLALGALVALAAGSTSTRAEAETPAVRAPTTEHPPGVVAVTPDGPPSLARLIAKLRMDDGTSFVPLPEGYLQVIQRHGGKVMPRGATLLAFGVKQRGTLVGAFVAALPREHQRCATAVARRPMVFWISVPRDANALWSVKLQEVSTRAFDGAKPEVTFPDETPGSPYFAVGMTPYCEVPTPGGNAYSDVELLEVWSLVPTGVRQLKSFKSYTFDPPGYSAREAYSLRWLKGLGDRTYLATIASYRTRTPTGAARDPAITRHTCRRTVTLFTLATHGALAEVSGRPLARLLRGEPALAKLPRSAKGDTEDECDTLDQLE